MSCKSIALKDPECAPLVAPVCTRECVTRRERLNLKILFGSNFQLPRCGP